MSLPKKFFFVRRSKVCRRKKDYIVINEKEREREGVREREGKKDWRKEFVAGIIS